MTPDWTKLAPHRPLAAGASEYEPPPSEVGRQIAEWVLAGGSTVLLGGPAGVGKSTELARAAALLRGKGKRFAFLAPVDVWENMRRLTADGLLLRIAGHAATVAAGARLGLHRDVLGALVQANVLKPELVDQPSSGGYQASPRTLAHAVLEGISRASLMKVTLLVDGMEKVPEGPQARELFDALGGLPDGVDVVTVVPWHVAFGPQAGEPLVRTSERFVAMRSPEVSGERGEDGQAFLRVLLALRLGLPRDSFDPVDPAGREEAIRAGADLPVYIGGLVARAAEQSGGLPRTFLQIMADAGTYARLRRNDEWPAFVDLDDAVADQQDSIRRILLPGDRDLLQRFDGSDGLEMDPGAKVRMLAQGLLLERQEGPRVVLRMHPLVATIVQGATGA